MFSTTKFWHLTISVYLVYVYKCISMCKLRIYIHTHTYTSHNIHMYACIFLIYTYLQIFKQDTISFVVRYMLCIILCSNLHFYISFSSKQLKHNVSIKGNYPNSSNYVVTLALSSLSVCVYKCLLSSRKPLKKM